MQKMGWFRAVMGHSGSAAMPPVDREHTTSYSTLIETMCHCVILYRDRYIAIGADTMGHRGARAPTFDLSWARGAQITDTKRK